nr:protein RRP5 homolog [Lytechinus pictus]
MEEDFPRGAVSRRTTRSADDKKKSFVQLSSKRSLEDVLFKDSEQATPSKGKKKRKTKKSEGGVTEEQTLEEKFEGETERDGIVPKPLTAKTLMEGMLVLAVIQEIHEYEIVLSLPNGLTAFVQITDISSYFTQQLQDLNESTSADDQELPNIRDVYEVGNLVPCKIKSLGASKDGHRRIQASLDYEEINSELSISLIKVGMTLHGCISSIEDHGYTINLGIKGTNAFLAKDDAARGAKGRTGEAMKAGKLVTCLVKAVKSNGRSIILTFDQERLKSSKATKTTHTTFSSLIPGTRLDVMVTKVLPNSLITDIFGLYKGCVDPIHLKDTADELTKYEIGQKVTAVILYNCPTTKSIGLSLNPIHQKLTFDLTTDFIRDLSPGDIIEDALVVRVQEKENLIVQLNKKMRGIVYHSHGSDDKQKRHSPASIGEKVRCRILNFNLFDRLAIVSLRQSILDKPFLGINDVKPGMLVTGVIESVMPRGVAVKIQDRIHGFVPRTHLADIPVQKPQERFTVGSEIELRVLLVEPSKRRVLLTHKKTMVKSSLPILASYSQPKVGMWVHGCVVAVKDFGCIVSFYNDVKGIIPRAELGIDDSASPADNFYVGQVLKCQVVRTHNPESKKLSLSLRKDSRREQESFEPGKPICQSSWNESSVGIGMEPCHQRDESQDASNGHTQTQEVPSEDTLSTSHCSQSVATKNSQGENQTHKSKDTWQSSALKLPATSSVGHNNVESYAPRNAPYAQYIKQHLPKEPSVTVHSNPVVIVPAEEYHQLLEMVKQNRKDIYLKTRIGDTLQSSKIGSALSSRECHQKTKGPASETKSCASEIQAPMSSTTSSWDGQDQIQEYPKEIEAYKKEIEGYKTKILEYKKEIKELKDWKQFVIKTLCGTQEVEQQIACTDIQEIDVGQQAEIQGQTTKLPKCGTSMTSNAKSHGDTNVPVLDDQDCCELEEYATAIEEDDDKSVTGLQTSSMKDEDMSEEEVTDFGEYENDADVTGYMGSEMDFERMVAIKEVVFELCPTEESSKLEVWKRCITAINDESRKLRERFYLRQREKKCISSAEIEEHLQELILPSGEKVLRVTDNVKKLLLPLVPNHRNIARRLVNMLFMDEERIHKNVSGRKSEKMDPKRMAAVYEAVFDVCPVKPEEKTNIWKHCITGIDTQNRNLKRMRQYKCDILP